MKKHKLIIAICTFVFCFFSSSLVTYASFYYPDPPDYDHEKYPYYALLGCSKDGVIYGYKHFISTEPIKINIVEASPTSIKYNIRVTDVMSYNNDTGKWTQGSRKGEASYTFYPDSVDEYGIYNGNHDVKDLNGKTLFRVPPLDIQELVKLLGAKVMVNLPIIVGGTICLVALVICLRASAMRLKAWVRAS